MKLQTDPILPADQAGLVFALRNLLRRTAAAVNGLAEGRIDASDAFTAAPAAGIWQRGDFVRNSAPVEMGTAGSKYVIYGFICVTSGTPGVWRECRFLTGN
jgi:hypothetical protein